MHRKNRRTTGNKQNLCDIVRNIKKNKTTRSIKCSTKVKLSTWLSTRDLRQTNTYKTSRGRQKPYRKAGRCSFVHMAFKLLTLLVLAFKVEIEIKTYKQKNWPIHLQTLAVLLRQNKNKIIQMKNKSKPQRVRTKKSLVSVVQCR